MSASGSFAVPAVPSSGDFTVSVRAATVAQDNDVCVDVDSAALAVIHLVSRSLCVCVVSSVCRFRGELSSHSRPGFWDLVALTVDPSAVLAVPKTATEVRHRAFLVPAHEGQNRPGLYRLRDTACGRTAGQVGVAEPT